MSKSLFFSPDELKRIEESVKNAESKISGEIVPVFVARSHPYGQAALRAGILAASLAAMLWLPLYEFDMQWGGHWFYTPVALVLLAALAFMAAFFAATYISAFRRLFVSKSELTRAVDEAAHLAFLKQEVFLTRHRTGILIFISLFEHRVEVLGDVGIAAKVSPDEWKHIVQTIVNGLKNNRRTEGICQAIGEAQQLLLKNGFVIEPDDTNELPDNLRL